MPTNELIPVFEPGDRITGHCTAAVRGKRLVTVSANPTGGVTTSVENIRVRESDADDHPIAAACYDGAIDEEIPLIGGNSVIPLTAGAAITAGQAVQSDAEGRVIPLAAGVKVGVACEDQATVGSDVAVRINL